MKLSLLKNNLKPVQKICISGLLIALVMILQKIFAINYIPVIPFLRISLGGPALIIFSSIFLGPLYGLFIGVASDVLGYFLLDPKMLGYFPQISVIYGVLGFLSFCVFLVFKSIKSEKSMLIIEGSTFIAILIGLVVYFAISNKLHLYTNEYVLEVWQKIVIASSLAILLVGLFVSTILLKKHFAKETLPISPITISFCCFIIEVLVMVILGSLMKGWAFGFNTYPMILICQLVVLFINVPLNTWLITLFLKLTKRFYENNV